MYSFLVVICHFEQSNDVKDVTYGVDADGSTFITFSRSLVPSNANSANRRQSTANFMTTLSTVRVL